MDEWSLSQQIGRDPQLLARRDARSRDGNDGFTDEAPAFVTRPAAVAEQDRAIKVLKRYVLIALGRGHADGHAWMALFQLRQLGHQPEHGDAGIGADPEARRPNALSDALTGARHVF